MIGDLACRLKPARAYAPKDADEKCPRRISTAGYKTAGLPFLRWEGPP